MKKVLEKVVDYLVIAGIVIGTALYVIDTLTENGKLNVTPTSVKKADSAIHATKDSVEKIIKK